MVDDADIAESLDRFNGALRGLWRWGRVLLRGWLDALQKQNSPRWQVSCNLCLSVAATAACCLVLWEFERGTKAETEAAQPKRRKS